MPPQPAGPLWRTGDTGDAAGPVHAPGIVHEVLGEAGRPLDSATRAAMEPWFGRDLSRVRVHTGTRAAESAHAVSALAYTVGEHIVFGAGRYDPAGATGRHLLAHELAHVVQQGHVAAGTGAARMPVSRPSDAGERLAAQVADAVSAPVSASHRPQAPASPLPIAPVSGGPVLHRQPLPGTARRGSPLPPGVRTGFLAHYDFIRERMRRLAPGTTLSPGEIQAEERTLRCMNQRLAADRTLADRMTPFALYEECRRNPSPSAEQAAPERPAPPGRDEFDRRMRPYERLAAQLRDYRNRTERLVNSPWEQRVWLVRENQAVQDVLNIMADRLMTWALQHIDIAHTRGPAAVLSDIAADPEMQALFRAAQRLPLDAESFSTQRDVPLWQRVARIAWGFIPVLGDLTDLAEAMQGWDMVEQRPLSGTERVIMLVGALLPLVPGSVLRGGEQAAVAATRLARTSGRSAGEVEQVLRAADAVAPYAGDVRAAVQKVRRGQSLTADELRVMEGAARQVDLVGRLATNTPARRKLVEFLFGPQQVPTQQQVDNLLAQAWQGMRGRNAPSARVQPMQSEALFRAWVGQFGEIAVSARPQAAGNVINSVYHEAVHARIRELIPFMREGTPGYRPDYAVWLRHVDEVIAYFVGGYAELRYADTVAARIRGLVNMLMSPWAAYGSANNWREAVPGVIRDALLLTGYVYYLFYALGRNEGNVGAPAAPGPATGAPGRATPAPGRTAAPAGPSPR